MIKTKSSSAGETVHLKIVHTSDVHGCFFMHDFVSGRPVKGSLARVYAYVQSLRTVYGDRLLLLDGGDMLQGTPVVYHSNVIAPGEKNLAAEVMNYMHYDAATVGNHDIETGHEVYDRWAASCRFPVLGANVTDRRSGKPYFSPYCMLERSGVRIAVLGLVTPAIPNWLSPDLWEGLEFEDMVSSAERWMKVIREREHPDVVVGLFHSGKQGGIVTSEYAENAALDVVRNVAGFDLVCYGHDHMKNLETVTDPEGRDVVCCSPFSTATVVGEFDVKVRRGALGKLRPAVSGKVTDISYYKGAESRYFQQYFKRYIHNTEYYVGQKIGEFVRTVRCEDAYFGPSGFVDLIHRMQLEVTGAQVSFAPPLSFTAEISQGDVHVRDMFNLYRYENTLYTMRFTGREIKGILEMSYGLWVNRMLSSDDHVMLLDYVLDGGTRLGFKNLAYNFDSAAGILYTVDVTKPCGDKIKVLGMADGTPFDEDAWYTVVTNSYRGNGGGEFFTKGAGIPHERLRERFLESTEKDLRYYLIHYIEKRGTVDALPLNHWKLVPEEWALPACERDRSILFGRNTQTINTYK